MKADYVNVKEIIIKELVNSGINVTPSILDFLINLEDPLKNTKLIIQNVSFLPNFDSHLTSEILQKISNQELAKSLKKGLIKEINSTSFEGNELLERENIDLQTSEKKVKTRPSKPSRQKASYKKNESENLVYASEEKLFSNDSNEELTNLDKNSELKISSSARSKSTLRFKSTAKDFDFDFEILKDPTGKIYTNGDYEDFYNLTIDKFSRLRNLMRKRPEVLSANNINNILRLTNKVEVSAIGIVYDIRKTKNGNFFLTLEDQTGLINIILHKDSENQENVKLAERILKDQMIYIEGIYNPGERGKTGIIYANYISKIDIPRDYTPNKSYDPISIALISDVHIGSKEFEEKLWNRFIDFLNGKIGNQNQRDQAGRIKYIIINGDLVDGIGVYPTQQSDLNIPDIYDQYKKAYEMLSNIPEYIKIFYSSGNHEPVRNAIPRPAVPKKYSKELMDFDVKCIGNPALVQTHNVNTLVFHGDSLLDLNMLIPGLDNNKPADTMIELLKCRHLAPLYGKKTQLAPTNRDWLVIEKIPDIFHTGHIHINGMDYYNNIALINSGCFQSQTDFMNSLGIHPTPGILSIIELDTLRGIKLDLKNSV